MYGTAGGDIVEHAAQPRERSSDTARGSGNPRDTASTSPSTLDRNYGQEKKTATGGATHGAFLDEYLGVQTSLRTGPCLRKANSKLADCHIRTPPLTPAWREYRCPVCVKARTIDLSLPPPTRRSPYYLAFSAGGRDIKSLLSFRSNTRTQVGS